MINKEPLVSVVVPVFQGERFLAETLDSIAAQTYPAVETIVVDDGSTDSGHVIARSREVRYIRQANAGVAAARNTGIKAARGDLIALLDQDDLWVPHKFTRQVEHMLAHPEVGIVRCRMSVFLEPGTPRPPWMPMELLESNPPGYLPGAVLARRNLFDEVGAFDTNLRFANDADWLARAHDAGVKSHVLDEPLLRYRVHNSNDSHLRAATRAELPRLFRAAITRKRQAAASAGEPGAR